jgi:hypothetical protein
LINSLPGASEKRGDVFAWRAGWVFVDEGFDLLV